MSRSLWSINALSTELGMDRRTLARKLETLPAADEKRVGGRVEKRWRLAEVMKHLSHDEVRGGSLRAVIAEAETERGLNDAVGQKLRAFVYSHVYPALIEQRSFIGTITGSARTDFGLSKEQAAHLYTISCTALGYGLSEALGRDVFSDGPDPAMCPHPDGQFVAVAKAINSGTLDQWIAENWPDAPAGAAK